MQISQPNSLHSVPSSHLECQPGGAGMSLSWRHLNLEHSSTSIPLSRECKVRREFRKGHSTSWGQRN